MRLIFPFLILLFFLVSFGTSKAQNLQNEIILPDSSIEKIIYEYDTVYLSPDTIKMVDTIVNYITDKARKKQLTLLQKIQQSFSSKNQNHFVKRDIPLEGFFPGNVTSHNWSLLVSIQTYVPGLFANDRINDSLTFKKTASIGYSVGLMYHKTKFIYSFCLGYSCMNEEIKHRIGINTSNLIQNGSVIYDSLSVIQSSNYHNYYQFLNCNFSVGYKWTYGKFNFEISTLVIPGILLNYSALESIGSLTNQSVNTSAVRAINLSIGFKPSFGYKLNKRWVCIVAPIFQRNLISVKKNPFTVNSITTMDFGFRMLL